MSLTREEILQMITEVLPGLLEPVTAQLLGDVKTFMADTVHPLADRMDSFETSLEQPQDEAPKEQPDTAPTEDQEQPSNDTENTETNQEEAPTMPQEDTLMTRVKLLEQQLADAAKQQQEQAKVASDLRFSNALSSELDKLSPVHKGIVQELLSSRLRGTSEEKETGWLTKEGKTLSESVATFIASPEGIHFLPSSHVNGVGAQETATSKKGDSLDLDSALASAFL